jgi:hypothetical protein
MLFKSIVLLVSMFSVVTLAQFRNESDAQLVKAVQSQKRTHFVRGGGLTVVKILPDDRQGSPHQLFLVKTSSNQIIKIVSNLDLCEKVPVVVGSIISAGGEFIWTDRGGLLHWTHHDPRGRRPHGFIEFNGKVYCQ